jgi:hypothetical protein
MVALQSSERIESIEQLNAAAKENQAKWETARRCSAIVLPWFNATNQPMESVDAHKAAAKHFGVSEKKIIDAEKYIEP